ncbi:hypothetical protein EAS64_23135 [Trebonia kvetii]|uniref:Uncharacterized protein n=2 Tax=Trebonia kvetii TaxID=2480626 RepID=A0A6P2BYK9_9ACTN|nr:hypothetical protein EAS64_23135 [Trebonia kvetii]
MTHDFEYTSYDDADRIAMLENRAAELERRLLAVVPPGDGGDWPNLGVPAEGPRAKAGRTQALPAASDSASDGIGMDETAFGDTGIPRGSGVRGTDGRTEALINHGRQRAKRSRGLWFLKHWRFVGIGAAALLLGIGVALLVLPGGAPGWPSSVAQVQTQIKRACQNPDVAAEPSGLNFACEKDTQQVLWIFSLLTSGNNPGYLDSSTGRKGLEPIQPAQGGDIAWSLNLHHPYNPANPIDSLEVAARAINNIISGATLTATNGGALVEPGLESTPANCQRYTGSSQVVTRHGYPTRCASAITSPGGQAALVSDVFSQWMGGTPSALAAQAGVLFQNAENPGDPRVQAILQSLPAFGR